jgi:hypothetical protein
MHDLPSVEVRIKEDSGLIDSSALSLIIDKKLDKNLIVLSDFFSFNTHSPID